MCVGPDGDIWFTEKSAIGRLNSSTNMVHQFSLPPGMTGNSITVGPDGNIWFTGNPEAGDDRIGRINPTTGAIDLFDLPPGQTSDSQIIADPDGGIWFGMYDSLTTTGSIGRLDPATGTVNEFGQVIKTNFGTGLYLVGLTVGPDGNIWFTSRTETSLFGVGNINPETGVIQQFSVYSLITQSITTGAGGKI